MRCTMVVYSIVTCYDPLLFHDITAFFITVLAEIAQAAEVTDYVFK